MATKSSANKALKPIQLPAESIREAYALLELQNQGSATFRFTPTQKGNYKVSKIAKKIPSKKGTSSAMKALPSGVSLPIVKDDASKLRSEILASLRPKEVAERLQVTPITVNNYRKSHKLLGFERANRYMYPVWQFDEVKGQPIEGLASVLKTLFEVTEDPIEVISLLTCQRDFFKGKSLKDLLLEGDAQQALIGARQSAAQ